MKDIFSLWLIGPTAAGKTTISKILVDNLKKKLPNLIRIDGDKIRKLYENQFGYDKISRSKATSRYISIVEWLVENNIASIVAVNSPFEEDRKKCRQKIKNYVEVYLESSLDVRIKRDKKNLYKQALSGEKKNVLGVDMEYDDPINCDLRINTDKISTDEVAKIILSKFKFLNK